jgi:hypothetical protein
MDTADHAARTVRAIREALARVPFYAKQGLAAPDEGSLLDEALAKLPLLTRDKIRATLPKVWLPEGRDAKAELAAGKIGVVETGAGDARVRVLMDGLWWRTQEARALAGNPLSARALAGELGEYHDAVLWVPERGTGSCGSGDPEYEDRLVGTRLHLNSRQDPTFWSDVVMTRMLDELERHETVALYADPFYLDVLARHAASLGRKLDVRGFIGLMRATTTAGHRAAIARAYDGKVLQIYGARETGILFVEAEDGLLHHAPYGSHVELLRAKVPTPGASGVAMVVVTTLERDVQPLVRYVLGDLVQVAANGGGIAPLTSVEGRLDDALVRPDGAIVTAGAVDRALEGLHLTGYQLTQRETDAADLEVVGGAPAAAKSAVEGLLQGLRIDARAATSIAVDPSGKYRSTRRDHARVPLQLHAAFEGVTP